MNHYETYRKKKLKPMKKILLQNIKSEKHIHILIKPNDLSFTFHKYKHLKHR